MKQFRIEKDIMSVCTRQPDKDDSWDNGDYHQTVTWDCLRLVDAEKDYGMFDELIVSEKYPGKSSIEEVGDAYDFYQTVPFDYNGLNVYMVIVQYYDGCTFGHTSGYEEVVALCKTIEQAQEYVSKMEGELRSSYRFNGYFSGLTNIRVQSFILHNTVSSSDVNAPSNQC